MPDGAKAQPAAPAALDHDLLPGLVGYQLRKAQGRVFQDFVASIGAEGMTPGLFGVLVLIEANAGLNQSRLGEALGVDRSTVVGVIDRLQGRGLVRRAPSPVDRRSYALQLTPLGRRLLGQLKDRVAAHEARIAARLDESERSQLLALLQRLG